MAGERYSIFAYHLEIHLHFQPLIASFTNQHLIKNYPQCPYIAFLRVYIIHVSLRCHIFGRAYIVIHLRFIRNIVHFTVSEVNYGYFFTYLRFSLKEDIVWLQIAMYNSFAADLFISFQDLSKDIYSFIFRQTICDLFEVVCQCSTFKQFSDQIYIIFLNDYIKQPNNIFMSSILNFPQITQCCYLTAQQISSNLIINFLKIDCLHSYLDLWSIYQKAQVNIASGSFTEKLRVNNSIFFIDGS